MLLTPPLHSEGRVKRWLDYELACNMHMQPALQLMLHCRPFQHFQVRDPQTLAVTALRQSSPCSLYSSGPSGSLRRCDCVRKLRSHGRKPHQARQRWDTRRHVRHASRQVPGQQSHHLQDPPKCFVGPLVVLHPECNVVPVLHNQLKITPVNHDGRVPCTECPESLEGQAPRPCMLSKVNAGGAHKEGIVSFTCAPMGRMVSNGTPFSL